MSEGHDPLAPTPHELAGGLRRPSAVALAILSLIGTIASALLWRTGVHHAASGGSEQLACDVNPLIGCSSSLGAPESHLFGIPNAALGAVAFAGLTGIALTLVGRRRLPAALWGLIGAGCVGGLAWIVWFLDLSLTVFRTLCPYCLVVWTVTIPIAVLVGAHLLRVARPGSPEGWRRILLQARWLVVVVLYAAVVAAIVVGLSDKVALLL